MLRSYGKPKGWSKSKAIRRYPATYQKKPPIAASHDVSIGGTASGSSPARRAARIATRIRRRKAASREPVRHHRQHDARQHVHEVVIALRKRREQNGRVADEDDPPRARRPEHQRHQHG